MPYCTTEDLKKLTDERTLLRWCDDSGAAAGLEDVAVASIIVEAVEQADSEIDVYLAGRYKTPLEPVPRMVTALSARITVYYLSMRRSTEKVPEKWENLYKRAVEMLSQISKGVVRVGAVELEARETEQESGSMVVAARPQIFTGSFLDRM
ncbi:gp436 family protein [Desulforegula conservatrix]|uniref:gp436 family protein n=1 Tax=Desulforegula conservatrix TaxID=153026 RepID=UPI0004219656|nr:DUF1320 domain-containing protein [Desulforegula conservatrix]